MEPAVESNNTWSKWWWVAYFDLYAWTPIERKVRFALRVTVLTAVPIVYFLVVGIFTLVGIDAHSGAPLAAVISILPGFFAARPIATIVFPDALRKADGNSKIRLRGWADVSTGQSSSTVLTFVCAGTPIGLAMLFVLLVPFVPVMLYLDTHIRQRAGDAVWESVSGRPFADIRFPQKAPI